MKFKPSKIHCLTVTYTVEINSVNDDCKKTALLGKKLLSNLCGFNDVKMKCENGNQNL